MPDLTSAFVTLFVTLDAPGLAPVFLALTAGMSRSERGQIAMRATFTALGILILFAVAGTTILALFGITLHAFRIAGGLLLFHIAFEMIFEKRQERREKSADGAVTADRIRDIAVFPLAIPLIAGPGRDLRDDPPFQHLFRPGEPGPADPDRHGQSGARLGSVHRCGAPSRACSAQRAAACSRGF
jgi:hypothetical protein